MDLHLLTLSPKVARLIEEAGGSEPKCFFSTVAKRSLGELDR